MSLGNLFPARGPSLDATWATTPTATPAAPSTEPRSDGANRSTTTLDVHTRQLNDPPAAGAAPAAFCGPAGDFVPDILRPAAAAQTPAAGPRVDARMARTHPIRWALFQRLQAMVRNGELPHDTQVLDTTANMRSRHSGNTLLHYAARQRVDALVLPLLRYTGANERNDRGDTPLHMAARAGNVGNLCLLAQAGGALDATNDAGDTPAAMALPFLPDPLEAAAAGDALALHLHRLAGSALNGTDAAGRTALMLATQSCDTGAVRVLLAASAQPLDARDNEGMNAAHHAAARTDRPLRTAMLALLARAGVPLDPPDARGLTPAAHLRMQGDHAGARELDTLLRRPLSRTGRSSAHAAFSD